MLWFKKCALWIGCVVMGACAPVLTSFPGGVQEHLSHMCVENIPERSGQYFRLALLKELGLDQVKDVRYKLAVTLLKEDVTSGVAQDTTIVRKRSTVTLTYTLRDKGTGKIMTQGTLKAHGGYNFTTSDFYANTVSIQADEEGILDTLCGLLILDLGRFFESSQISPTAVSTVASKPQAPVLSPSPAARMS